MEIPFHCLTGRVAVKAHPSGGRWPAMTATALQELAGLSQLRPNDWVSDGPSWSLPFSSFCRRNHLTRTD